MIHRQDKVTELYILLPLSLRKQTYQRITLCVNWIHYLFFSQEEGAGEEVEGREAGREEEGENEKSEKGEEKGGGEEGKPSHIKNRSINRGLNGGLNSVHTWNENVFSGNVRASFRLLWAGLNFFLFIKICTWPQINQIYRNNGAINRAIEENVNKISCNVANILHLSKECFFSYSLEGKNGTRAAELSCPGTGTITSALRTCQLEKLNLLESYRIKKGSQWHIPHEVQEMCAGGIWFFSPCIY